MRLWMGDDCRMVVLMCWEMRTTICSGFVPRKRFMRDKIDWFGIWYQLNVLVGTNPSIVDIPYRSNVLNGTERFSMTFCSAKTFYAGQNMFRLAFGAVQTF